MKKRLIAILILLILLLSLTACAKADVASPAESPSNVSNDVLPLLVTASSEIDSANTAEELRALIQTYQDSGDHESAYLAAKKLIDLEPTDTQAYQDAIAALLGSISSDYDEIQELLTLGIQNTSEGAERLVQWANEQNQTFSYTVPFFSDYASESEINLVGTTAGNMTNLELPNMDLWLYGLMTRQGSWVYFALPSEDFSIYKMRTDGTGIKKIADARGDSINVVGDWLYYRNLSDERKPYRIRTDGTNKEGPLFNGAGDMVVTKDWIYYLSGGIYKTLPDMGETVSLVDGQNASMSVYDGWIYYCTGGNNSEFCRVSTDGGEPQKLLNGWMIHYDMSDGWIYYQINSNGDSVWRMRPDGSEQTELYRSENPLSAFAVIRDQLVVSVSTAVDDRGKPVPTELRLIDVATQAVQETRKANTGSIYVANDTVFYTENGAWQLWNLSTGFAGAILVPASTGEVSVTEKYALSLEDLGFIYEQEYGAYGFKDEQANMRMELSRPDLKTPLAEYNMLFLCDKNGYTVAVWYHEDENMLRFQADKGESSATYQYDLTSGAYIDEWTNTDSIEQQFTNAFGKQEGDYHEAAMKTFTDTIQQYFGISWQELYALPLN